MCKQRQFLGWNLPLKHSNKNTLTLCTVMSRSLHRVATFSFALCPVCCANWYLLNKQTYYDLERIKSYNTTPCTNSQPVHENMQVNIALWSRLCDSHLLSKDTSPLDVVITSTTACSTCCDSLVALCSSLVLTRQRPCMLICRVWATACSFSAKLRRLSPPTLYVCAEWRKKYVTWHLQCVQRYQSLDIFLSIKKMHSFIKSQKCYHGFFYALFCCWWKCKQKLYVL